VGNLEQLEVVDASLGGFKSSSDRFHLSPDIDEGFRFSRTRDFWIFKVGKHEIEFRHLMFSPGRGGKKPRSSGYFANDFLALPPLFPN